MQQGEELGPMFQAAQVCRTSGNTAQCFNAIGEYAKAYSQGQEVDFRNDLSDQDTRYGYDMNVIDHSLIAGKSTPLDKSISVMNPNDPTESISIQLPRIRKEESPSLHANRSVHFNQAFPIHHNNNDNLPNMNLPPHFPENIQNNNNATTTNAADNQQPLQMTKPLPPIRPSSSSSHKLENISDMNKDTYAALLFIGILFPLVFIFLVILLENMGKR